MVEKSLTRAEEEKKKKKKKKKGKSKEKKGGRGKGRKGGRGEVRLFVSDFEPERREDALNIIGEFLKLQKTKNFHSAIFE